MIRVLVVDDSPFFRRAISRILERDPEIKVIGFAKDGEEAVEKVMELSPDVVTLDVEMPRKDGLEALKEIMEKKPTPVIMVSALTKEGAEVTLKALELGALDFIPKGIEKGMLHIYDLEQELINKVKAVKNKVLLRKPRTAGTVPEERIALQIGKPAQKVTQIKKEIPREIPRRSKRSEVVGIGTSTGGPPALQKVLGSLPKGFEIPILIVQHMPPLFTKLLAERLNNVAPVEVKEAEDREPVRSGFAYVAPGGKQMEVVNEGSKKVIKIKESPPGVIFKPSVNITFKSIALTYGGNTVAAILTGMGNDGAEGAKEIKKRGGTIIAEDESTCVVYGMPRAVVEAGVADIVVPLDKVAEVIVKVAKGS